VSNAWLRRFGRAVPGTPRLVCFPHAGGAAATFRPLAKELEPDVEVVAVQYPGRQDRRHERPATDLAAMAADLAAVLDELPASSGVGYLGHSMGAVLAFEVARRVARRPEVLLASASRSPANVWIDPAIVAGEQALEREILALGATTPEVLAHPDLRAMVLPAVRADYAALAAYRARPGATVPIPIVALVGDADPRVSVAHAARWAEHTSGRFELKVFPGGHFYLIPRLSELARTVEAELAALV
jgi:surfactin synthase thioesterase subunit